VRFRTRVVEVEAQQFTGGNVADLVAWLGEKVPAETAEVHQTAEAVVIWYSDGPARMTSMTLIPGHWIVWDGARPWVLGDIAMRGRFELVDG
jgi:hypothetical protein